jgi:dienelactone hydrolase
MRRHWPTPVVNLDEAEPGMHVAALFPPGRHSETQAVVVVLGMNSNHELDRFFEVLQLTDSTKSLKSSKASKAGSRYKIGTKYFPIESVRRVAASLVGQSAQPIGFTIGLSIAPHGGGVGSGLRSRNATVYSYPGQHRAFARHNGTHYNATAAELANGRTSEFLHQQLR